MIWMFWLALWMGASVTLITAPWWGLNVWARFGPGSSARRKKIALNDAMLDGLSAHVTARSDIWDIDHYNAECKYLRAKAWIANDDYGFTLQVDRSAYKCEDFSKAAIWRFINSANGKSDRQSMIRVSELLTNIEKSINESSDNVVNMSARK